MSHIYVFSPSGAVRDRAAFRRGVRRLEALGHQVEVDPAALDRYQRFAGDDPTRVAAVARAAASGADVAMMSRGGYGLTRILPDLPWKAMAKAVERGLRFVGHSDFTALQLGLLARTGASSWAGPGLTDDFGSESEPDEIMAACFDDLLLGQGEGTGWRLSAERGAGAAVADPALDRLRTRAVHGATLWGGNLSMLVSLLGTPWWPEVRGGVLFLEDVNEHPFRIERMLTQLLHAGVLGRQKALLLGSFTQYRLTPADRGFSMKTVVQRLRSLVDIPVLTGLPFGHVPTKVLLPVGAKVDLALDGRDALLVWGHV
jgi:muramoyltetrapeptide carboxypeptidase